jgi:D-threonine aldolase
MWYKIKNINEIDTPALLIYKDRASQNIAKAIKMAGSVERLRPHVKTHKIKEVAAMMQAAGIQKFKCATIAEAEMLAMINAQDVLLAYPIIGPKTKRLKALKNQYPNTHFSCLIDNFEAAKNISEAFLNDTISVYIDLNVGMNRTGILPENSLLLYQKCQNLKGIDIIGLHAYDGHIHDTDLGVRTNRAKEVSETLTKTQINIENFAHKKMKTIVGGSPTFAIQAGLKKDAEVSPGTFIFWDYGYQNMMPDFDFLWAGIVATRVISIINKTKLCLDLGHKSIAAENPLPRIKFLDNNDATPIGQNEEHMVVEVSDTDLYAVGDVWCGVPVHICPTVALYNKVSVVENEVVTGSWKVIARDRDITV